jgi:hypothetical protein
MILLSTRSLKIRGKHNDRYLEAEVRHILELTAKMNVATARQCVMEIRKRLKGREFADSVYLIHEKD